MSQELADTLRVWVEDFLADMLRRGYSKTSHKVYRCDLFLFVDWVAAQNDLKKPGDLTAASLEQYQMHLMLRPSLHPRRGHPRTLSAGARNRHLASLRSFFRYLKKVCKLLSNPSLELERAREPKRIPKTVFTVPEMARLLAAVPKETAVGLRDWAAVEILYGSALRRNELIGLKLSDLRLAEGLLHVLGKGNKERVVPLGKAACRALELYLRQGRPALAKGEHQALLVSGRHGGPVSQNELLEAIRKHARQAGIRKNVGFHLFRHTAATHLLRGGADLRTLQALLGHADLNATAIYTRVEISDLQKTLKECHPREQDFEEKEDP